MRGRRRYLRNLGFWAVTWAMLVATTTNAANRTILVHTGPSAVSQDGVYWNNLTSGSADVQLRYTDGSLSGLTYAGLTGYAVSTDNRHTSIADLANHGADWVSSLDDAGRSAFATNFSQNNFEDGAYSTLNLTGLAPLTGRDVSVEVVATYGATTQNDRRGHYQVNGEFTALDGGAEPTYKPSQNFQNGHSSLNYMRWDGITWGSGAFAGDQMTIGFRRADNTSVLNGFKIDYDLPGISASFDHGTGTDSPAQYHGRAGDGWTTAWHESGTVTAALTNTNPLAGGGSYLSVSDIGNGEGVTRQFESFADIDVMNRKYKLQADVRIDSETSNLFQIGIRSTNAVNSDSSVLAWARVTSGQWTINDSTNHLSTGIEIVTGHVYHLEFVMDQANDSFYFTIDDLDDNEAAFVSGLLATRNTDDVAQPWLFIGRQHSGTATAFSVDSILISVPTPAALPAGLTLLGAIALRRRRR